MAAIEAEALAGALNGGKVRRKVNNTRKLRLQAARVTGFSAEVMVKITGFGKGAQHVKNHLDYISRHGKVELETDRGDILSGKAEVKELFAEWAEDFGDSRRRKNQRDTMHLVLSMPEGTPDEAVRSGARTFARETFAHNHEYVFALHTDALHPHVHVTVKMLGFDGRRLNPRKADLDDWREGFALHMRDQGVDAEATRRMVRGVVRKAENSIVRHIERGDDQRPPRVPRVKALRVKQAAEELSLESAGAMLRPHPILDRVDQAHVQARNAWQVAAAALERTEPIRYKERANERPDYDRLDTDRVRAGQRAAAVYQSDLEGSARKAPAAAIARMRDVSRLAVVQHQRPAQVLLLAHAPDRVGQHGPADHDLRWAGAGAPGAAGGSGGLRGAVPAATSRKPLPEAIRGLVGAMPAIETERSVLKQQLAARFTSAVGPTPGRAPGTAPQVQTPGNEPPAPPGGPGLER